MSEDITKTKEIEIADIAEKEDEETEKIEKKYVESVIDQNISKWSWQMFIMVELAIIIAFLALILGALVFNAKKYRPPMERHEIVHEVHDIQDIQEKIPTNK